MCIRDRFTLTYPYGTPPGHPPFISFCILAVVNWTVIFLSLIHIFHEAKHHVNVRLDMDEMDLTAAESKATYEEINSQLQGK